MYNTLNVNDRTIYTGDTDPVDSFLGIGKRNQEKKAAKKLKKAEKQLAKGHTKAAARKLGKANKALEKVTTAQTGLISGLTTAGQLAANKDAIEAAKASLTPPQLPASPTAYDPTNSLPQSAAASPVPEMGGGGGGTSGGDSSTGDEPTGQLAQEKELPGVTVTSHKKLPGWVLPVIGGVILLLVIFGKKLFKKK